MQNRLATQCRILTAVAVAACASILSGCVRYEVVHYTPLTFDLDGQSELHISSYPSWFPRETTHVPFLYKKLRTPASVYFQVFVKDADIQSGRNVHAQSVRIRSFNYQRPGEPEVQLISDYESNFWMQDQPTYNLKKSSPVPCEVGKPIQISIALEINDQAYAFERQMICAERRRTGSLLLHALAA